MADYDPQNIPILDDIIKDDKPHQVKTVEASPDRDSLYAYRPDEQNSEPESTSIVDESATTAPIIAADEEESLLIESALIDYQLEEIDTEQNTTDFAQALTIKNEITPSLSLETIVNDVVDQLMPDLEQQLRDRLLQALIEKLPTDDDSKQ